LLRLERENLVTLPPRIRRNNNQKKIIWTPDLFNNIDSQPISGRVDQFNHIHLEVVRGSHKEKLWDYLIDQYHYLGYRHIVGRYLKYLVYINDQLAACIGWGLAAWKVGCRDRFVGWNTQQRKNNLSGIASNVRFLIKFQQIFYKNDLLIKYFFNIMEIRFSLSISGFFQRCLNKIVIPVNGLTLKIALN